MVYGVHTSVLKLSILSISLLKVFVITSYKMDVNKMLDGILERSELQENGCLKWTGSLLEGRPSYKCKTVRNYVWKQFNGTDKIVVLQNSCGDETCINIHHLYIEDIWDNVKSRIENRSIIDENGCHLWQGCVDNRGYGTIKFKGKTTKIHRITYMIDNNIKEIPEGIIIRHKCNKHTNCHYPGHLESGSYKDNAEDRRRDGTILIGEKNPSSKITKETATLIKHSLYPREHEKYKTIKRRAEYFNVGFSTVAEIDQNRAWAQIPDREGNINMEASKAKNKINSKRRLKNKQEEKEKEYTDEMYDTIENSLKENSILTSENKEGNVPGDCWENKNKPDKISGYTFSGFYGIRRESHAWGAMCGSKRKRGPDDKIVRHLCNNTICCNPTHVNFGTYSGNSIDSIKNGSKSAKLDEHKVREIRKSIKSINELSSEYGVDYTTIRDVLKIKSWTWVKP